MTHNNILSKVVSTVIYGKEVQAGPSSTEHTVLTTDNYFFFSIFLTRGFGTAKPGRCPSFNWSR